MADPVATQGVTDVVGLLIGGGGSGIGGGALMWYLLQRKQSGQNGCSAQVETAIEKTVNLQELAIGNQSKIITMQQQILEQLTQSTNAVVQVANAISGLRGFMEGRMMK